MQAGQPPQTIVLSGPLNVERASTLKEELTAALEGSDNVLVNVASIDELDLSCLQVLYAAAAEAKAANKQLHFAGSLSSRIVGRLSSCGFFRCASEGSVDFESALGLF
jgi:anti-anti-sigma regulatory factor